MGGKSDGARVVHSERHVLIGSLLLHSTVGVIWDKLLLLFILLNFPVYKIGIITSWMSRRLNEPNK